MAREVARGSLRHVRIQPLRCVNLRRGYRADRNVANAGFPRVLLICCGAINVGSVALSVAR